MTPTHQDLTRLGFANLAGNGKTAGLRWIEGGVGPVLQPASGSRPGDMGTRKGISWGRWTGRGKGGSGAVGSDAAHGADGGLCLTGKSRALERGKWE